MAEKRTAGELDSSDTDVETESESEKVVTKAKSGSAKYKVKFKLEWEKLYPVRRVINDPYCFFCVPCNKQIRCSHQGLKDIKDHCSRGTHKAKVVETNKSHTILQFFTTPNTSRDAIKAEVMVTNFLIQHNLPIATSAHLGPLFRNVFPDSKIAKSYACSTTKTAAIVNEAMGPHCHEYIVQHCIAHPFSLGIDGSSDTDVEKMNPVTIRVFDINRSKFVTSHFYDMCVTTGRDAGKAEEIFNVVDAKFATDNVPWANAVSLSVDNTNSMIGKNNSFASRCKEKNANIFISGCPCHLVHIAAGNGHDAFAEVSGLNVEELQIDLYYWFEKSTKRKGVLTEYMDFCDETYAKVLKHVSTRWLSLERCVERTLAKYEGLKSYFLSEDFADERFNRLKKAFNNPLTEVSLFFHHASIPLFNNFNKLLQSDEPVIHMLQGSIEKLAMSLANRIIKPQVVRDTPITELDLSDATIYKPKSSIFLGGTTKMKLQKLLNDGDISERDYAAVFSAAQAYFKTALNYILTKFPVSDEVIMHSRWIDVQNRIKSEWESVEFFLTKFQPVFEDLTADDIFDEFCDYQTMNDQCIGENAFKEAKVIDGEQDGEELFHYRMDVLWWHISNLNVPGTATKRFPCLQKLAELVLVLPHSNAGEERLFSIVRKNKTESRASLKLEGTLSNLLAMKLHYPEQVTPCFQWVPSEALLDSSKKAASAYNAKHTS